MSEDKIIEILSDKDKLSMELMEIARTLGIKDLDEIRKLESILDKMTSKGILYYSDRKKKYMLLKNSHLLLGKMILKSGKHGDFGFVEIGEGKEDIYIATVNLNGARHGDIVLIEQARDKTEGRVIRVIERNSKEFVGEFYMIGTKSYVHPDNKDLVQDILIPREMTKGAVAGSKVLVKPLNGNKYVGEVTNIIGHKDDVGIDIVSFVYEHGFRPDFPEAVIQELDNIPDTVSEQEMQGRKDLRDVTIFTIDGADTKDIDDAVSIKKVDDTHYELGVHIADVSNYVKPGMEIEKEAYERGTSVYLVDRVIPMLPHKLSNGICSLNEGVDRLALSCIMTIDTKGVVTSYEITPSVIQSRKKMTYDSVNNYLEKGIIDSGYEPFTKDLSLMNELSKILRKKMIDRGYIEFEDPEAKILVDDKCHPYDIKLREQRTGEQLIENFMIVANETVASYIFYRNLPGIYRVHDKPDPLRIQDFMKFLSLKGYVTMGDMKQDKKFSVRNFQMILKQIEDKPDSKLLNRLAIRCQKKAIYDAENIGHFGLGSKCYAHFTSPIRRYPDLTLHRLVKDYQNNYTDEVINHWEEILPDICEHSSQKEQDSVNCERDVDKMKKAEYMEDHIGEIYDGVISGVTEFGIFVELDNTVEGLIKAANITGDYYFYDEDTMSLVGKNSKKRYTFGDPIRVKVIAASRKTSTVDFELVKEYKNDQKEEKKKS